MVEHESTSDSILPEEISSISTSNAPIDLHTLRHTNYSPLDHWLHHEDSGVPQFCSTCLEANCTSPEDVHSAHVAKARLGIAQFERDFARGYMSTGLTAYPSRRYVPGENRAFDKDTLEERSQPLRSKVSGIKKSKKNTKTKTSSCATQCGSVQGNRSVDVPGAAGPSSSLLNLSTASSESTWLMLQHASGASSSITSTTVDQGLDNERHEEALQSSIYATPLAYNPNKVITSNNLLPPTPSATRLQTDHSMHHMHHDGIQSQLWNGAQPTETPGYDTLPVDNMQLPSTPPPMPEQPPQQPAYSQTSPRTHPPHTHPLFYNHDFSPQQPNNSTVFQPNNEYPYPGPRQIFSSHSLHTDIPRLGAIDSYGQQGNSQGLDAGVPSLKSSTESSDPALRNSESPPEDPLAGDDWKRFLEDDHDWILNSSDSFMNRTMDQGLTCGEILGKENGEEESVKGKGKGKEEIVRVDRALT